MLEMPRPDSPRECVDAIPLEASNSRSHPPLSPFSAVPAPNPREGRQSSPSLEHSGDMPGQEASNLLPKSTFVWPLGIARLLTKDTAR